MTYLRHIITLYNKKEMVFERERELAPHLEIYTEALNIFSFIYSNTKKKKKKKLTTPVLSELIYLSVKSICHLVQSKS